MCLFTGIALATGVAAGIGTSLAGAVGATSVSATTALTVGLAATVVADVALTGAIAGGVMGTVGAIQQAEQQREAADFQAQQEAENARLARKEAEAIEMMGNQERAKLRQKMLEHRSAGRTGYAAGGVVLGSGTTLDYEADIAEAYESDKANLEYDIATKKWQKKVAATNAASQSAIYRAQAKAAGQSKTTSLFSGIFDTTADTLSAGLGAASTLSGLAPNKSLLKPNSVGMTGVPTKIGMMA